MFVRLEFGDCAAMDPELEFQLQCEAEEKRKAAAAASSSSSVAASSLADAAGTYTDPQDGTVYEWDTARKAWFPKVCEEISLTNFNSIPFPCSDGLVDLLID